MSSWRKIMAVGCTHGPLICPVAAAAVVEFKRQFEPDVSLDLGDINDWAAFRTGAGAGDLDQDLVEDFAASKRWLEMYQPTHRCFGNHDNRVTKLSNHPNKIIRFAASALFNDLAEVDRENGTIVKPYRQRGGWHEFGGTLWGHGWMYNEQAIRDHAEAYGRCVIAHLHVPGTAIARNWEAAQAWCVGMMGDPEKFPYAADRRNTLRWGHGLVWGYFNDTQSHLYLESWPCKHGEKEDVRWML